jgi:hypothetical protein
VRSLRSREDAYGIEIERRTLPVLSPAALRLGEGP